MKIWLSLLWALLGVFSLHAQTEPSADSHGAIIIQKNFQGSSLGKVEIVGPTKLRCHVMGQYDQHGRNRQASWYYFKLENIQGKDLTLTLTDFVGEYNNKPGACPMTAQTIPVYSYDNETWHHFDSMDWDDNSKEATLRFRAEEDGIWIAHVPPYTTDRLTHLLNKLDSRDSAQIEVIGKSAQGRDLHLVTVTDFNQSPMSKRCVWLIARQHAWEAGTSYVMEGALRFITSQDERARALRQQVVFKFVPMMDPDGAANGQVRFNANGYDVNRHWDKVDIQSPRDKVRMPEIYYVKKCILQHLDAGLPIHLMVNMHNTESAEFLDTQVDDPEVLTEMRQFLERLDQQTTFESSRPLGVRKVPSDTTNSLYDQRRVPVLLMEQRTSPVKKLGRQATPQDRLEFGAQLIQIMGQAQ